MNNLYDTFDNNNKNLTFDNFISNVFMHMSIGLILSAVISYLTYYSLINGGVVFKVISTFPYIGILLCVSELIITFSISAALNRMSTTTIRILFYLYAILTGLSFSTLFISYSLGQIFMAFVFASVFFVSMVIIGKTTKLDLTKYRTMFIAGLISLLVVSIISIFIDLSAIDLFISWFGLILFIGLTAYDIQKLRHIYYSYEGDDEMENKLSIYAALDLYLDFINMFIYILRIFGNRRSND